MSNKMSKMSIIELSQLDQDLLLAHLEAAYSLIWGSHEIWGKGGVDTLALYDK